MRTLAFCFVLSFLAPFLIPAKGSLLMSQSFDLTREVSTFSVNTIPVILRSVPPEGQVTDEIFSMKITAFGGAKLADTPGVLEMMTRLMMRGSYSFSKEQIDETLTRTGTSLSISASGDSLSLSLKCLKKFLPEILPMVSDMIRNPKFDPQEMELVRTQLINDLKSEQEQPDSLLGLKMAEVFYGKHPYAVRPTGYLDTVPKIKRDDLTSALFKTFNKSNVLFTVVSMMQREELETLLEKYFVNLPEGRRMNEIVEAFENETSQVHFVEFDAPTTYFMAKFSAPNLASEDYPALAIATQILDNKLFEEVRTKRGLTYSVYAGVGNSRINSGTFYVSSIQPEQAVEVMLEEIKKMQAAPVSKEEIELQVRKFLSGWYSGRETRSAQASIFELYEVLGIGWENSNSFIDRASRVTPEDIQRVMETYFQNMSFVTLGPKKPELEPILAKYGFLIKS